MVVEAKSDGYTTLDVLLLLQVYRTNVSSKIEDIRNMALRLLPLSNKQATFAVINPIRGDIDPLQALEDRTSILLTMAQTKDKYLDSGYHGMIIHRGVIAPIKFDLTDQEDLNWAVLHEDELYPLIAERFVFEHKLKLAEITVTLFPEWGFVGGTKTVRCRPNESTGKGQLYGLLSRGIAHKIANKTATKKPGKK